MARAAVFGDRAPGGGGDGGLAVAAEDPFAEPAAIGAAEGGKFCPDRGAALLAALAVGVGGAFDRRRWEIDAKPGRVIGGGGTVEADEAAGKFRDHLRGANLGDGKDVAKRGGTACEFGEAAVERVDLDDDGLIDAALGDVTLGGNNDQVTEGRFHWQAEARGHELVMMDQLIEDDDVAFVPLDGRRDGFPALARPDVKFAGGIHAQGGGDVLAADHEDIEEPADEEVIDLGHPAVVLQPQIVDDGPVFGVPEGAVDVMGGFVLGLCARQLAAQLLLEGSLLFFRVFLADQQGVEPGHGSTSIVFRFDNHGVTALGLAGGTRGLVRKAFTESA